MARRPFKGSDLRRDMPIGGIKLLSEKFDISDTWVRKILDGKASGIGTAAVLEHAMKLINEHKRKLAEEEARREALELKFKY